MRRATALSCLGTVAVAALALCAPGSALASHALAVPTAPQSLSTFEGAGALRLAWTPPASDGGSAVLNYTIYRGTGGPLAAVATVGNVTGYNDSGLSPGTEYCYRVAAANAEGEGPTSSESCSTTFAYPSAPLSLTADAGDASVSLAWVRPTSSGNTNIQLYTVYRSADGGPEAPLANVTSPLSFTDTGLVNGASYTYRVSASNIVGEGPLSAPATAVPFTNASEPLSLTAAGGLGSVSLSWARPAFDGGRPVTDFVVYGAPAGAPKVALGSSSNTTAFTHSALARGATYCFEVRARNLAGEGPASSEGCGTTWDLPGPPRNLTASPGDGQVSLAWEAPAWDGNATVTVYAVYRGDMAGNETFLTNVTGSAGFLDTAVVNGAAYWYRVGATNAVGSGPLSTSVTATPFSRPGAPRSLSVARGLASLSIGWLPPAFDGGRPLTGYVVYRGAPGGTPVPVASLSSAGTAFTDTGLADGTEYCYAVSAVNPAGEGNASTPACAFTFGPPGTPTGLAANPGNSSVTVSWGPPASDGGTPVTGFAVFAGPSAADVTWVANVSGATQFEVAPLANGVTVYLSVAAFNLAAVGPMAPAVAATPGAAPGAPSSLAAERGVRNVTLRWAPPADLGGFAVEEYRVWSGAPGAALTLRASVGAGQASYVDGPLPDGAARCYAVSALNGRGEGPRSAPVCSSALGLPGAPVGLIATPGHRTAALAWSAPGDTGGTPVTAYRVWRGTAPGTLDLVANTTLPAFESAGLLPGTTYYFAVSAVTAAGEGERTPAVAARAANEPPALAGQPPRSVPDGVPTEWSLSAADPEGDAPLSFTISGAPAWITVSGSGRVTFAPQAGTHGRFTYTVSVADPQGASASWTFEVAVGNRPPAVGPLPLAAEPGVPYTATASVTDADGDTVSLAAAWDDATQSVTLTPAGAGQWTVSWTPAYAGGDQPGFLAWLDLTLTASDGADNTSRSFAIRVRYGGDAAPRFTGSLGPLVGAADQTVTLDLRPLVEDDDDPFDALTVDVSGDAGAVADWSLNASSGLLSVTFGQAGSATLTLSVSDPSGRSATAQLPLSSTGQAAGAPAGMDPLWAGLLVAAAAAGAAAWLVAGRRRRSAAAAGAADETAAPGAARAGAAEPWPVAVDAPATAPPKPPYLVEDVFLLYRDGRPMFTRGGLSADSPEDPELVGTMLVAVQEFVRDAFRGGSHGVDRMDYGDNSIALERGNYTILAATIFGQPDAELKDRMRAAVANIEGRFAGVIEMWDGNKTRLTGLEALLAPLWLPSAGLTRADVALARRGNEVLLLSGLEFFQGYVRLKVSVVNNTPALIAGATVDVDFNGDVLRLQKVEPATYRRDGSKVNLGVVHSGERATLAYYFDPQICTSSAVEGTCRYKDTSGTLHVVQMKTRTAEVLCPLFFTKEQANTAMLKRLIETELHQFDVRGYAFASDAPESELEALFDVLRGAVAAHDVVLVRSHVERRPFRAEAWFYGKTQVKGYEFVVRAHADASKGQAEFFAASSAMRPVTGLLAELHRTFTAGARTRVPTLEVRPIFDERLRTPYADSRAVSRLVEAEAEPGDTGLAEA